jgi:hypothetical protein
VRVPEEAGLGTAKVVLSFAAWKEGNVAPGTVEVPIVAATKVDLQSEKSLPR